MNSSFMAQYGGEIGQLTLEHLWLTGTALLFAAAIAIPAGIVLTRAPRWAKVVIGATNIIQTIPSLALFGFCFHCPGLVIEPRASPSWRWQDMRCCQFFVTPIRVFAALTTQFLRLPVR